eukprot:8279212-Heterocapsa_arctica.AAC.1
MRATPRVSSERRCTAYEFKKYLLFFNYSPYNPGFASSTAVVTGRRELPATGGIATIQPIRLRHAPVRDKL